MRLLLDANLSPEVARRLGEAGHDAVHVADLDLLSAPDPVILQAGADQDRVLVTADADFGALLALGSLATPSVVLLRSADHMTPGEQAELLAANLAAIAEALGEGAAQGPGVEGDLAVRSACACYAPRREREALDQVPSATWEIAVDEGSACSDGRPPLQTFLV